MKHSLVWLWAALWCAPAFAASRAVVPSPSPIHADSTRATPRRHVDATAPNAESPRTVLVAAVSMKPDPRRTAARTPPGTLPPQASALVPATLPPQASALVPATRDGVLRDLAIEPLASGSHDSDGNRTFGAGIGADFALSDGVRLGLQSLRTRVEDGASSGTVDEGRLRVTMRPIRTWRLEASAGGARSASPMVHSGAFQWIGALRSRWRATGGSPAVEVRMERAPLVANPLLLADRAMRTEGRFGLELPLRMLRLRSTVRGAQIESAGDRNWRGQVDGAVALVLSPAVTPWVQYRSLGYLHPSNAGYFAPRRIEVVESGSSFEIGGGSPWELALDLGGGLQRIATHGEAVGGWKPALRGYGYLGYTTRTGCGLRLEAESEDSPGLGTTNSESWRYHSLDVALRWALP